MEAYRDGDLQAFDHLFNKLKDPLYRYLLRQTGNSHQAEEIFQDTWAAIIRQHKNYSVKSKFRTYLYHIAHTKLIDYYRTNNRHALDNYDEHEDDTELFEAESGGLEHRIDVLHKFDYLQKLLDKLPAAQRDIFLLHQESGLSLNEIAESMQVSLDTAKSRLKYALTKLRRGMERLR